MELETEDLASPPQKMKFPQDSQSGSQVNLLASDKDQQKDPFLTIPSMPKTNELHANELELIDQKGLSSTLQGTPVTPSKHMRLNPTPATIDKLYHKLPTMRFVDSSVFCEVPAKDLLNEAIAKAFSNLPSNQRPQRTLPLLEHVIDEEDSYKILENANAWRAIAHLAKNDLIATHPIEVELIMQLWTRRLNALLRLKHYEIAEAEIKSLKIGNTREFNFNQYPEIFPDKNGAMLSFEFLMVINSLPSLKGLHNESINNYYKMLNPQNIWDFRPDEGQHKKIVIRIIHALSKIPDIPLAIDLLKNTLIPHQDSASLQAWLGRLQLQLGQLNIAQSTFSKVSSTIIQIEHSIGLSSNIPLGIFEEFLDDLKFPELIYTNRGLLNFSAGHHDVAIKYFSTLLSVKPDCCSAVNNIAICYLYSGNVSQASSFLESFIVSNPKVAVLNAEMVSNLVSMYDLTDSSSIKKKALLKVIIQDCGDDFEPDCMKL